MYFDIQAYVNSYCHKPVFGDQTLYLYYTSKMPASVASDQYKLILEPLAMTMDGVQ